MSESSVLEQTPPTHEDLLREACRVFGINPDPDLVPRELAAWKPYGSADLFEPLSIVLVTAGGRKLRYPIDERTENELRYHCFNAFKVNKTSGVITELPLPANLRLPRAAVTGIPDSQSGA